MQENCRVAESCLLEEKGKLIRRIYKIEPQGLIRMHRKTEADLLRQVAEQVLGRPFEEKDGKDFTMIHHPAYVGGYDLAYKGQKIGSVIWDYENEESVKWVCTFTPSI